MQCSTLLFMVAITAILMSAAVQGQTTSDESERGIPGLVTTQDGKRYKGILSGWNADTLMLVTADRQRLAIAVADIQSFERQREDDKGQDDDKVLHVAGALRAGRDGLHRSRYGSPNLFLIPTAYPEDAWDLRVGVYELFFPAVSAGIGGYATVHAGASMAPAGLWTLFHATVKVTPLSGRVGAVAAGVTALSSHGGIALPFVLGSIDLGGIRGAYATLGGAYRSDTKDAILLAGIDIPVNDALRFMVEAVVTERVTETSWITPGLRLHVADFDIDLGFLISLYTSSLFLPWVSASVLLP
jgi:hypothetical protein